MSHSIPPELLGAVPRRIRRRQGHGRLITFMHVFILPHTLAGIGVTAVFLFFVAHALLGTVVPGRVTGLRETTSSKGKTSFYVDFAYDLDDHPRTGGAPVSHDRYQALVRGDRVDLKVFHVGSLVRATVAGDSDGPPLAFMALWLTVWNGFLSVTHWQLTVLPLLRRRLVRVGSPIEGKVTGKRTRSGKSIIYLVAYQYAPAPGPPIACEVSVRASEFALAEPEMPITVLYDPAKPGRSVAYELADYEAVFA